MALCSLAIAAGIIGVVAVVKRLVWRGAIGCGRFRGHRGGYGAYGGYGPGRSFWLRALFHRLDTTPGQEKEIRSALEEVQKAARDAKGEVFGSRESLARALTGESFDGSAIDDAESKVDAAAERVKQAVRAALERVHGVLDGKQRERLAELLQRGARGFRRGGGGWGGPYRSADL
jgi:Spy/CpxP family protein refolding chaperone